LNIFIVTCSGVGKLYEPASADELIQAFKAIDINDTGYIDAEVMERLLLTKGEAFRQQELDDFFALAADPETGRIFYEDYVALTTKGRA
jgi:Ca2+-binding EF-hand superfamily protein